MPTNSIARNKEDRPAKKTAASKIDEITAAEAAVTDGAEEIELGIPATTAGAVAATFSLTTAAAEVTFPVMTAAADATFPVTTAAADATFPVTTAAAVATFPFWSYKVPLLIL
jgi:hypothetical protein